MGSSKTQSQLSQQELASQQLNNMDERTMARLGKAQELKRQFGPLAMAGFGVVLGASWQSVLVGTIFSLGNGGATGTVVMYFIVSFGLFLTCCSLAEMASFAPTAGGQYHWVSELAPGSVQKPMSYILGWCANAAWQLLVITCLSGVAQQIQGLVVLWYPEYVFATYQTGLMVMALLFLGVAFNFGFLSLLPSLEFFVLIFHVAAYVAVIFVLLFMGPRGDAASVFKNFNNANEWPAMSTAVVVGSLGPLAALTTADSMCHMAEEVKDASKWLPRIIILSNGFNYLTALLFLFAFLFRAGDINAALTANPNMPWVAIMYVITGSYAGTTVIVTYVILSLAISGANMITTASRQLYAFARDGGVPFSPWVCKVNSSGLPANALLCTLAFGSVLSLIITGTSIFLNIVTASYLVMLLFSYIMSLSVLLYRRLTTGLPQSRFSLGKLGIPVNIAALVFCSFGWVVSCFPPLPAPGLSYMNWACVIFVGVLTFPIILYVVHQHRVYVPPVVRVRQDLDEGLSWSKPCLPSF